MRRRPLAVLGFGVLTITAVAVLVAGLTGALTVVITHGDSMEPTYHAGDVVVVRQTDTSAVGDIAAYHSPLLGQVVLHRIVDTDRDTFVLSGDNNDWLDPERPAGDELLGTAWLHVPKLGIPAHWLGAHPIVAAAGAAVLVAATGTATATKRRTRTVHKHSRPPRPWLAASPRQLAAGLLVGLLGFGLFAAVSWTRPTTTAGPVDYTHDGEFTYTATAATGPVYDSPRVHTGQPLFLALIDDLRVGFSYRMTVDEPAVVRGTIALDARIDNGTGWTRTLQLAAPQLFEGHQAHVAGGLDIDRIRSLVAEAAEATGESGVTTITLHPQVTLDGELAGRALPEGFRPSLAYQLTDTQLRVAGGSEDDASFTVQETGQVQAAHRQAATFSWAGRAMDVTTARWLSLIAAISCAAGLLILLAAGRRTAALSEAERITRRWPELILPVDVEEVLPARVVRVRDMAALVTLAQRSDQPLLHDRATDAFLIELGGSQYRYEPAVRVAAPPSQTQPSRRPVTSGARFHSACSSSSSSPASSA